MITALFRSIFDRAAKISPKQLAAIEEAAKMTERIESAYSLDDIK